MIIFGRNTVREAILANWGLKEIRIAAESEKGLKDIIQLAGQARIRINVAPRHEIARMADDEAHQGIVAIADDPREISLEDILPSADKKASGPLLLLDGVEDPRNFGAILRSALAAGAMGVVLTRNRAAPLSPTAVKASAGAAFTIPIARVTNLARTIEELKERGFWVYGASVDAEQVMYDIDWAEKSAIVLGGEGEGLHALIRKKCDVLFRIPLKSAVQSLNVSVAAGVILFEIRRKVGR